MTVIYRDEIGIVSVTLPDDDSGRTIDFCDGYAYFTAGDQDYRITVSYTHLTLPTICSV